MFPALILTSLLFPCIAMPAWQSLPAFDAPVIAPQSAPCWHQGELYLVGRTSEWTSEDHEESHVALWVYRDGAWHVVRSLGNLSPWLLASDGTELVVMDGQELHWLRDRRWRDEEVRVPGSASALVLWNGRVVAGGEIGERGTRGKVGVAAWNGQAWASLGGGIGGVPLPRVNAMMADGGAVWVAGRFERAGDLPAGNVARWDGIGWDDLGGGADGEIVAMAVHDGGVAIAGTFTQIGGNACDGLALWRDGAWIPLPAPSVPTLKSADACPLPAVTRLVSVREGLLALGRFSFVDPSGETVRDVAVLVDGKWQRWLHAHELFGNGSRRTGVPFRVGGSLGSAPSPAKATVAAWPSPARGRQKSTWWRRWTATSTSARPGCYTRAWIARRRRGWQTGATTFSCSVSTTSVPHVLAGSAVWERMAGNPSATGWDRMAKVAAR
jgi:hypothetical protein